MSEASKAVGAPAFVEFRGKRYAIPPLTIEMIGLIDAWMEDRAYQAVSRSRGKISDEEYRDRLDSVTRMIVAGDLAFGSPTATKAIGSLAGFKFTTLIFLKAGNPNCSEVDEKFVDEIWAEEQEGILRAMGMHNLADPITAAPEITSAGNS